MASGKTSEGATSSTTAAGSMELQGRSILAASCLPPRWDTIGFWGRRVKMSATSSNTAAWMITWRSWSGHCWRDTSAPRLRTRWVRRGLGSCRGGVGGVFALRRGVGRGSPPDFPPSQAATPSTSRTLSSSPSVLTFTSAATLPASSPSCLKVRLQHPPIPAWGWGRPGVLRRPSLRRGGWAAGAAGGGARLQQHADRLPRQPAQPQLPAHQLLRLRSRG